MIEYQNVTNELVFSTKDIPQNCGGIKEQIRVDNYNSGYKYFLEMQCPNNRLYISKEIKFLDGIGTIELPDIVTQDVGKVYIQLVMRDDTNDIIGKSLKARTPLYMVNKSINAHIDLAKESRTGDFIEFLVKNNEDMLKTKRDLDNKVATGFFKGDKGDTGLKGDKGEPGKDGTLININGNPQQQVSFTSNPQEQFDERPTIKNVNTMSMCPGNSREYITVTKKSELIYEYYAQSNGYFVIEYKGEYNKMNAITLFSGENTFLISKKININNNNRVGIDYIPVSKGQKVTFYLDNEIIKGINYWFVYAKEI